MVKGNLQLQSSSHQPFFRIPQNLTIFAEMTKWVVHLFILIVGGLVSAKLHGLTLMAPSGLRSGGGFLFRIQFEGRRGFLKTT